MRTPQLTNDGLLPFIRDLRVLVTFSKMTVVQLEFGGLLTQLPDLENLCGHDTGGFREQFSLV